jgi:endogenous inhibitor of DNA gyrase (YacG/DUF329 family)
MKCPICKKAEVKLGDADFPFCSERCRVTDLANWSTGKYAIPAERPDAEPQEPSDE